MIPGVFPTRQQAEIQTRWAFQNAAQEPLVLYSILAISSAERSSRLGELKNGAIETTYTQADLENRQVADFVSYKLNAVKLANETMKIMETAAQASTIFAMMCLLAIEVPEPCVCHWTRLTHAFRAGDYRESSGDAGTCLGTSEIDCLAWWISWYTSARYRADPLVSNSILLL